MKNIKFKFIAYCLLLIANCTFAQENLITNKGKIVQSTTAGTNLLKLPNPSAITFPRINADNTVTARTPAQVLTDIGGQGAITLTTTGTSGASTLVGNTLNIPNYASGGGVSDGDKGDVVVSGSGTIWTVEKTTVGNNFLNLANPSAIRFPKINADNTVSARTASELSNDIFGFLGTGILNGQSNTSFSAPSNGNLAGNIWFNGNASAKPLSQGILLNLDALSANANSFLDVSGNTYTGFHTLVIQITSNTSGFSLTLYGVKLQNVGDIGIFHRLPNSTAATAYAGYYAGNKYQELLVSGTNIKTVNGSSILGSGNLTVSASETDPVVAAINGIVKSNGTTISAAVAGDFPTLNQNTTGTATTITGNIAQSQVTGLVTDLSNKQPTLVSATNIKTINGTSVLGSGDLTVTGSDPWTYVKLSSEFPTGSATAVDITGLAFTPAANTTYEFEALLMLRTATTTVGPRPGLAWNTGNTDGTARILTPSSATAFTTVLGDISASLLGAVGGLPNTTRSYQAEIKGTVVVGTSPSGNIRLQMASETAATNVFVRAGSWLRYRVI